MSIQLVLETSGSLPFVVLHKDGKLLHSWVGNVDQHHSQSLLAGIDECLRRGNVELKQLSSIAIGVGPGMFTGLRIGVATAKFLADAHGIPTVPFSSLLAVALSGTGSAGRIWALNDARSKRVYSLLLEAGDLDPLRTSDSSEEIALSPSVAATQMRSGDCLLGEGSLVYKSEWPAFVQLGTPPGQFFRAEALAALGNALFLAKRTVPALNLEPRYLKTGQTHLP